MKNVAARTHAKNYQELALKGLFSDIAGELKARCNVNWVQIFKYVEVEAERDWKVQQIREHVFKDPKNNSLKSRSMVYKRKKVMNSFYIRVRVVGGEAYRELYVPVSQLRAAEEEVDDDSEEGEGMEVEVEEVLPYSVLMIWIREA